MDTCTIADAAARTGFTPSTLRYYEQVGLVEPQRTEAGYRLYDERALQRLSFISRSKALGLSLEEIAELVDLWDGDRCGPVQDRLRAVVTAAPQYPMLFFNLACCESLSGQTSDALDHLRHAIEMSEEFRDSARSDSDLDPIRDEPAFKQLIRD